MSDEKFHPDDTPPQNGGGDNQFFQEPEKKPNLLELVRNVLISIGLIKAEGQDLQEGEAADIEEEYESPEKKRAKAMLPFILAGAAAIGGIIVLKMVAGPTPHKVGVQQQAAAPDSSAPSLFGDEFRPDVANLKGQLMDQEALQKKLRDMESRFNQQIKAIKQENEKLKQENAKLKAGGRPASGPVALGDLPPIPKPENGNAAAAPAKPGAPVVKAPSVPGLDPLAAQIPNNLNKRPVPPPDIESPDEFAQRNPVGYAGAPVPGSVITPQEQKIYVYSPVKDAVKGGAAAVENAAFGDNGKARKNAIAVIPASTIGRAVLLNGVDAPTGASARKDPIPVVMQFLADGHTASYFDNVPIKGCRLLASGAGDLASERGYFLTERLVCVAEDGRAFSAKADGYILGEDGKAGIRGRLVSKQGSLIAKSFMAGLLQGFGNVISTNSTQTSISPLTGTSTVLPVRGTDLIRSGIGGGLGEASKRIADFYMKMAESIFPVIEIDAGRKVEVVFTHDLKFYPLEQMQGVDGNGYWDIPYTGGAR